MKQEFWLYDPTVLLNKDHINEMWPKQGTSLETKLNAGSRLVIVLSILGYLITMNISFIIIGFITLAIIGVLYNVNNSQTDIISATAALLGGGGSKKDKEGFDNLSAEDTRRSKYEIFDTAKKGMNRRALDASSGVSIHGNFTNPSPTNPLMNVMLPEIGYAPNRANAMPVFVPEVETQINETAKTYISSNFDASARNSVPENDAGQPQTQNDHDTRDIYNKLFSNLGDSVEFEHSMRNFHAMPNTRIENDQAAFAKFCYGDMRSCKEGDEFACSRNSSRIGQIVGA